MSICQFDLHNLIKPDNFAVTMAQQPRIDIRAEGGKAVVKIRGYIYEWAATNSRDFEARVDEIIAQGIINLEVCINSPGGDPFEANQIGIILDKFTGEKVAVIEAMAASSATMFLGKFTRIECYSNSQIMIHQPKGYFSGSADEIEASVKALRLMKASMIDDYARLTGKTTDAIEDMLKADYWMDAKEAKKLGFVHKVRTGKGEAIDKADLEAAVEHRITIPFAIAATATQPNNQPNPNNMSKILMLAVGLGLTGDDANNEEKIMLEAQKAIDERKTLKAALDAKDVEIAALKNAEKVKAETRATAAIEAAFKANKIDAEQKKVFEAQVASNPDFVIQMLDTMKPHVTAASLLNEGGNPGTIEAKITARKDWNFEKWSKEDENGLAEMKAAHVDVYRELFKSTYGKYPK